jgi:hypothetical protein
VRGAVFSWVLNGIGAAEITIDRSDLRATTSLLTKAPMLIIYSEAGNWGGVLKRGLRQNGSELVLSAWSNERLLRGRRTDRTRSLDGKTNGVIAQTLLTEANAVWPTQVTVGNIFTAGIDHYYEIHYDDLLERFQDMAATDDHDFEVTWDRQLNWYETKGVVRPNVVLAEGRNVVRHPTYTYSEDTVVNDQVTVGYGTTWADELEATTQDTASQNAYGLSQAVDDFPSIKEQPTLDLRAATLLASRKAPEEMIDLKAVDRPSGLFSSFHEGDWVRAVLSSYKLDQGFDQMVRVLAREVDAAAGTMRLVVEV